MLNLSIELTHYLALSGALFATGLAGIVVGRRNVIAVLIAIEVLLLAVNINFVAFSYYLKDLSGQIFTIFILTVAAAEVAVGLALVVLYYRQYQTLDLEKMRTLQG